MKFCLVFPALLITTVNAAAVFDEARGMRDAGGITERLAAIYGTRPQLSGIWRTHQ